MKTNLDRVVHAYKRDVRRSARLELSYYAQAPSFKDAVERAALARMENGQRHPHQRRLKQSVLATVRGNLEREEQRLRECTSFEDILELVQVNSVPGFGPLAQYDTSLRLGAWLSIRPTTVYLHAGTRVGARKIGLDDKKRGYITLDQVPPALRELEPYEIEDVLCIYKDDFESKAKARSSHDGSAGCHTQRVVPKARRCGLPQVAL